MTSSVESNINSTSSDDELGQMLAPLLPDFKALARDIQNRNNHIIGTDQMEARHFREFFGTSLVVVEKVWELLDTDFLLPDGYSPKHLLWALHFMKVYPKQSVGCTTVGASEGAVDPKTHRKWVWAFIDVIAELSNDVVMHIGFIISIIIMIYSHHHANHRLTSRVDLVHMTCSTTAR